MPPLPPALPIPPAAGPPPEQQRLYDEAATAFGPALVRLATGYERDPHRRQDLLQDVHFALWRSLAAFDGRCALRTWVYRVAHNVAASHALRDRRRGRPLVALDALEDTPAAGADVPAERLAEQIDVERQRERLAVLVAQLAAPDRQLVLLYLEGLDAAAIGDVTGLSPANVATRVHRIKRVLAQRVLAEGVPPDGVSVEGVASQSGGTRDAVAHPLTHPEVIHGR